MYSETLTQCLHAKHSPSGRDTQGKNVKESHYGISYIKYMLKVGEGKKQGRNHLCGPGLRRLNRSDLPLPPVALNGGWLGLQQQLRRMLQSGREKTFRLVRTQVYQVTQGGQ